MTQNMHKYKNNKLNIINVLSVATCICMNTYGPNLDKEETLEKHHKWFVESPQ